jgi:uncharacterized protein (DUF2384 family)
VTSSETVRVFEIYHRLLALYEPHEAVLWLVIRQQQLKDRSPCELLATTEGYGEIVELIDRLRDAAQ